MPVTKAGETYLRFKGGIHGRQQGIVKPQGAVISLTKVGGCCRLLVGMRV